MPKVSSLLPCFLMCSVLVGCHHNDYPFLYRPPLSQGNVITTNTFAALMPGMSKAEVINLVGEPILSTPFSPDVWHYVYLLRQEGKNVEHKNVTLYFQNDKLAKINDAL